jgi:hypothetical protein
MRRSEGHACCFLRAPRGRGPARHGCAAAGVRLLVAVVGLPSAARPPASDIPSAELQVVGATYGAVDTLARNALADLETYWAQQFPDVFGQDFVPLRGGYFSADPNDVDPGAYPQGIGCGSDPRDVEGNAFYCQAPDAPNSDSISYDRAFLGSSPSSTAGSSPRW